MSSQQTAQLLEILLLKQILQRAQDVSLFVMIKNDVSWLCRQTLSRQSVPVDSMPAKTYIALLLAILYTYKETN